jgi:hypothetical protein
MGHNTMTFPRNILRRGHSKSNLLITPTSPFYDSRLQQLALLHFQNYVNSEIALVRGYAS